MWRQLSDTCVKLGCTGRISVETEDFTHETSISVGKRVIRNDFLVEACCQKGCEASNFSLCWELTCRYIYIFVFHAFAAGIAFLGHDSRGDLCLHPKGYPKIIPAQTPNGMGRNTWAE